MAGDILKTLPGCIVWSPTSFRGRYSTLSAALGSIGDAAANKRYTILVVGDIQETATIQAKSYVDVQGVEGATVTVTLTAPVAGGSATVLFDGVTNSTWRGLTGVLAGTDAANVFTAALYTGTGVDDTVRIVDCVFRSQFVGLSDAYGGMIYDSYPVLERTRMYGGAAGSYNMGLFVGSAPAATPPVLYDCDVVGGINSNAYGIFCNSAVKLYGGRYRGDPTASGANSRAMRAVDALVWGRNVEFHSWGSAAGVMLDNNSPTDLDADRFPDYRLEGCTIYGGTHGLYLTGTTDVEVIGGEIRGGLSAAGHGVYAGFQSRALLSGVTVAPGNVVGQGIYVVDNASVRASNCHVRPGAGGTGSRGIIFIGAAQGEIDGCTVDPPGFYVNPNQGESYGYTTATCQVILDASRPLQIRQVGIYVWTPGTGGATLSIGTTLGGTDIVNAQSITSAGVKDPTLGVGILPILAAGATIYITITGTGSPELWVTFGGDVAFTSCQAVYLGSSRQVSLRRSRIRSGAASDALYIADAAVTANVLGISGCQVEAAPKDSGSMVAIRAQSPYSNAPIRYTDYSIGGLANVTVVDLVSHMADTSNPHTVTAAQAGAVENAGNTPTIQADALASRPAAGNVGAIYIPEDGHEVYRDNGTEWVLVGSGVPADNGSNIPYIVSKGSVTWDRDYVFEVSPFVVYFPEVGNVYCPPTEITLDAPDDINDRIDLIVANSVGTVAKITGTPAPTPAAPDYDLLTQCQITFITVGASTVEPPDVVKNNIYLENTEWTYVDNSATLDPDSLSNPRTGSKSIEGTNVVSGNYFALTTTGSAFYPGIYTYLVLWIRPKATFEAGSSDWYFRVFLAFGSAKRGSYVSITDGAYGFDSTSVAYQQVAIPVTHFGVPAGQTVNRFYAMVQGPAGTHSGFNIDDISLQYGVPVLPSLEVPDATTTTKGIVELAEDGEDAAGVVVQGDDSRLDPFTGDSGAGGVKGLVPAPAAGDTAASKFLKADGGWEVPPDAVRACIIELCSAFTPEATGADVAEHSMPPSPADGETATTWKLMSVRFRVSTAGGAPSFDVEKSTVGGAFSALTLATVTMGNDDNEVAVTPAGPPVASTGDEIRFNVTELGTAQDWTITTVWVELGTGAAIQGLDPFIGDAGAGGAEGLVPAPAAGDAAAGKYLKADGFWVVPPDTGITKRACVIGLCQGFTPAGIGADVAQLPLPPNPDDGTSSITWKLMAVQFRVETAGGAPAFDLEKSTVVGAFSASALATVTMGNGDYEVAVNPAGPPTAVTGNKVRFNVTTLGTAANWTIATTWEEQ